MVYNSLAHDRIEVVCVRVDSKRVRLTDGSHELPIQINPFIPSFQLVTDSTFEVSSRFTIGYFGVSKALKLGF